MSVDMVVARNIHHVSHDALPSLSWIHFSYLGGVLEGDTRAVCGLAVPQRVMRRIPCNPTNLPFLGMIFWA